VPVFRQQDGTRIKQYADNGGNNQKWRLQYDGAGYYKIVNVHSNKLMDVVSGSQADGRISSSSRTSAPPISDGSWWTSGAAATRSKVNSAENCWTSMAHCQ
jgi:hypothetical protein